jgi:phosphoribosylamine--glycine ligase
VIEECLTGPEVSLFFLLDGQHTVYLGSAQDHKRIFDDDRGPNTGGMGAFAPSPLATLDVVRDAYENIVQRVIDGHAEMGQPYRGFLYVSLMLTPSGPRVIEFNVRFGDPEAQVVLPLIDRGLFDTLREAAGGGFARASHSVSTDKTVGVVLASRGYPASAESGVPIEGVERAAALPGVTVFHAGTKMENGRLVTAGGRVLTVVGRGATYQDAMTRAYAGVDAIRFDGMQYRRDIGRKAIEGGK